MTSAQIPICRIIAGPNGAGKTTFALTYLRQFPDAQIFVNADLIAAGLSPLAPQQQLLAASRLMLKEIDNHIQARRSFAFETTLSGRGYLQLIRHLRSSGWRVELVYLALPSVELSILRVAERVAHGGHDVPLPVLRRRFPRSLQLLLDAYAPAVDHALSPADQQILEALQQAVAAELDRKARLGHYIAIWQDGRAVLVGPDAPPQQER